MNEALLSSAKQDWQTPYPLFRAFHAIAGGFDLDAAADAHSACVDMYFGPGGPAGSDCLTASRWPGSRVWLNPPYGRQLPLFIAKAVEQSNRTLCDVYLLVPARTDTRWWALAMTRAVHVWFLAGRVRFLRGDGVATEAAPFPSAVIRLGPGGGTPSVTWGFRP